MYSRKRFGVLVMAVAFAAALLAQPATVAQAKVATTQDSKFPFYFSGAGATQGTDWRSKDTYSSTYINVTSMRGNAPRMYVDGSSYSSGYGEHNCTNGGYVRVPGLGKYEIHNSVRESGYRFARLTGWADNGWGAMSGVWSPDCAGNYADLN